MIFRETVLLAKFVLNNIQYTDSTEDFRLTVHSAEHKS